MILTWLCLSYSIFFSKAQRNFNPCTLYKTFFSQFISLNICICIFYIFVSALQLLERISFLNYNFSLGHSYLHEIWLVSISKWLLIHCNRYTIFFILINTKNVISIKRFVLDELCKSNRMSVCLKLNNCWTDVGPLYSEA